MGRKAKSLNDKKGGEIVVPAVRFDGLAPRNLSDVKNIRNEMSRVYRYIWEGRIMVEDATKLIFCLDKMVQALKSEVELATIQNQYMDAWSGVNITPPTGATALPAPAPHVEIIEPETPSEENNDEQ